MSVEQAFLVLIGVVCAVLGWLARELWSAVQQLRKDLSALQVAISTDFVRYDRLKDALAPISQTLDEIKHTLAGKADK